MKTNLLGVARNWFDGSLVYMFKNKSGLIAEITEMSGCKESEGKAIQLMEMLSRIKLEREIYLEYIMNIYPLQRDSGISIKDCLVIMSKNLDSREKRSYRM